MFDIGYSELFLTAIIALLVLGPDRLPGAMRTTGLWIGRMRRSFERIRLELESEVGMDEIRRQVHNDGILEEARRLKQDLNAAVQSTQDSWRAAQDSMLPDAEVLPAADAPPSATTDAPAPAGSALAGSALAGSALAGSARATTHEAANGAMASAADTGVTTGTARQP